MATMTMQRMVWAAVMGMSFAARSTGVGEERLETGFAVRPFGAVVFGRIGDLIGRKYAFMLTITIMGLATFIIGQMPRYDHVGIWAPVLLMLS